MRFFWRKNEVYAYDDVQIEYGLSGGLIELTNEELDKHLSPEKYYTNEQKSQIIREHMPVISPMDFDIKLIDAKLYDSVQELIKTDKKLEVAYTRATYFSRTDPFIDQARIALGLTNEQVDELWNTPL